MQCPHSARVTTLRLCVGGKADADNDCLNYTFQQISRIPLYHDVRAVVQLLYRLAIHENLF